MDNIKEQIDNDVLDLTDILNSPTEVKEPQITSGVDTTDTTADVTADNDDFAPETPENKIEEKTKEVLLDSSKLAPNIVDMVDLLLSKGMPFLYDATLNTEDKTAMKIIAQKYKAQKASQTLTLTEEDQRIISIYIDREEYCKELELSEKEKKSLVEPLSELLKDVNYQASPSTTLLIAIVLILIPRLFPVGVNYFVNKE